MRSFGTMLVGGVAAIVALKVLFAFVLPMIAFAVGLVALVIKIALIAGVGWIVYTFVRGRKHEPAV